MRRIAASLLPVYASLLPVSLLVSYSLPFPVSLLVSYSRLFPLFLKRSKDTRMVNDFRCFVRNERF